jgi:phytoene dehydrogenase-like protein
MDLISMAQPARKIVIIGAGIAGLCAAVLARTIGYEVEVVEQHNNAGGLATSWRRGDYQFETCLHWLLGSGPASPMHALWREVFDIDKLTFVYPDEFERLENEAGERLCIYTDVDRMEAEFLRQAPQDADEIRHFASAVRRLGGLQMPDPGEEWPHNWLTMLHDLPYLPALHHWSGLTCEAYGERFSHKLLRRFFGDGELARLSALTVVLMMAWLGRNEAGYPIGGSHAIIRGITDNLMKLGGRLRLATQVEKIMVQDGAAVGIRLADGETIAADWVISAADGHATIYDLLDSQYRDQTIDLIYQDLEPFPSYLQVSLGVARTFPKQPGFLTRLLTTPLTIDPGTVVDQVSFRLFHYDPSFAPPGKTAVTCVLPTRNFSFWSALYQNDPQCYEGEKNRVAEAVIAVLEEVEPDVRRAIEVIDVATPATVIRYTGNWKGSMEGWLLTPATGLRPLPQVLPGLHRFLMVGQWVMPGGGLPSGLMTARSAIRSICRQDRLPWAAAHRL